MITRNPFLVLAAGAVVTLSACQDTTNPGSVSASSAPNQVQTVATASVQRGKTAEEKKLEQEVLSLNQVTRDIVVNNTIQGALAGAAVGCVLAHLNNGSCGRGAVAGGLFGGVAGNQVGQQAAEAKRDLVQADQTIAKLKNVNARLGSVEEQLRAVVSRQNSEISSLRRQLAAGQVSKSSYDARISAINNNRQTVIAGLAKSENNVAEERALLVSAEKETGQQLSSTRAAVDSTRSRISSLRRSIQLISS